MALIKSWRYAAFFAWLIIGPIIIALLPSKQLSTAQIIVEIQDQPEKTSAPLSNASRYYQAYEWADKQIHLLKSPAILQRAVKDLALQDEAEINGDHLLSIFAGWLKTNWLPKSQVAEPSSPMGRAVATIGNNLLVTRAPNSLVFDLSVRLHSAEKSAEIANRLAETLVTIQKETDAEINSKMRSSHRVQQEALRAAYDKAANALAIFKINNNAAIWMGHANAGPAIIQHAKSLNQASTEVQTLLALVAKAQRLIAENGVTESLPEALKSPLLEELRHLNGRLNKQIAAFSLKLGPKHEDVLLSKRRLAIVHRDAKAELQRILADLQENLVQATTAERQQIEQMAQLLAPTPEDKDRFMIWRRLQLEQRAAETAFQHTLAVSKPVRFSNPLAMRLMSRAVVHPALLSSFQIKLLIAWLGALFCGYFLMRAAPWQGLSSRKENAIEPIIPPLVNHSETIISLNGEEPATLQNDGQTSDSEEIKLVEKFEQAPEKGENTMYPYQNYPWPGMMMQPQQMAYGPMQAPMQPMAHQPMRQMPPQQPMPMHGHAMGYPQPMMHPMQQPMMPPMMYPPMMPMGYAAPQQPMMPQQNYGYYPQEMPQHYPAPMPHAQYAAAPPMMDSYEDDMSEEDEAFDAERYREIRSRIRRLRNKLKEAA